ncbi:hypothetical protein [Lentibacillus daqui]|nr:hypothetical protein [Lentibacillus daqui]
MNACQYVTLQDKVVNAEEISDYKEELQGKYMTLNNGRIVREFEEDEEMRHLFVDPYPGRSAGTGEKVKPFEMM